MRWHKRTDTSQGNTMEQYTTPVPLPQRPARLDVSGDDMRVPMNPEEPSREELLAAIQGSRVALEDGRSHFFDRPEEVWRLLEMWDEVALGRKEGTGGVALRASGEESLDWRSHEAGQLVDAGTGRSAVDSNQRVEIQQDGTMAVMSTGLAGGLDVERGEELGGILCKSDYDLHDSGCHCASFLQGW
ncbi:hypothetical protein NDU88_001121 [Pleurodeles waltl]|uniref:Uncharacterized protein n=1 Tax=Pleurodeles waltl TaxID=8319 RepID=A0AAV7SZ40_PLEWA|nr:hypothetical protein NDU88_001121 [Pleurodeles waltl]